MPPRSARRFAAGLVAALAVGGVALAAPAGAAAPTFTRDSQTVTGDLTGDGVPDRLVLGYTGQQAQLRCAVQLSTGLGGGQFAAPVVMSLPVRGVVVACPDLGVVLRGPSARQNRLAVTFFEFAPSAPNLEVQLFGLSGGTFTPGGSFAGMTQPSAIATQDFDGDGWGDIWETTDQGDGFQAFVGRHGTQWRTLYATPPTSGAFAQFVNFDHGPGTDILVSWSEFGQGAGVAAVEGVTGAVQVLATSTPDDPTNFEAFPADYDNNRYLDIHVGVDPTDELAHSLNFVNRCQGGHWYFQPLS